MEPRRKPPPYIIPWSKITSPGLLFVLGLSVFCLSLAACRKDIGERKGEAASAFTLSTIAKGFDRPLDLQAPGDASGRLFIVEQGGRIRIIQAGGRVLSSPFLDIGGKLYRAAGEEGLLGLAFHPNFAANGRLFVNYTGGDERHTVIAEYKVSAASPDRADPSSERILLTVAQPYSNHNGGGLAFDRDGYLLIALGDGGSGGDPQGHGQNLDSLLGKMLRIDVDAPPAPGLAYAIPPDNPFVEGAGRREIWLYGLRNPYRFSVDRTTGNIWIGDVGQNRLEEVDRLTPDQGGANLGWNVMEGTHCFNPPEGCSTVGLTPPIFDYPRDEGDKTVIGGYVYRGSRNPSLAGLYVFGDFVSGRIWTLAPDTRGGWIRTEILAAGEGDLSAFGQGQDGELYITRYSSGVVARIQAGGGP